ncbi:heparan-alpha-glucosaminide N-acetyltransferase-like [Drosophila albomicans]|uniref:Heparan-alpha-glucosaminide N-acetyltransferase-like n=1 Tax=Drosophila albomicans TaxID=7291 RepID=A0A6P8XV16_DROAB|nr:heparan-alpha-glucosaminide N-acetyltransferase-like [Drosophila albomicans]
MSLLDKMSFLVEYTEPQWRDLDMRALLVDQAFIYLESQYPETTYLYYVTDHCYTCPFSLIKPLPAGNISAEPVDTVYATSWKIYSQDQGPYGFDNVSAMCTVSRARLEEFSVHNLTLFANGSCNFVMDKPGVNVNYAFLSVFLITAAFLLLLKLFCYGLRRYRYAKTIVLADNANDEADESTQRRKARLRSLDTFRGLTIVLMIFVNNGGGEYKWIAHAYWNGINLADIVFPNYMWMMGVCIPFSIKAQLSRGISKSALCWRIFCRACKLFALGIFWNSMFSLQLETMRQMGVLQRLGISYFVVALLQTLCTRRKLLDGRDLLPFCVQLIVLLALVATYLGVTFGLPVPNCPLGYLGPGGTSQNLAHQPCTGGGAFLVDRLLGTMNLSEPYGATGLYNTYLYDPEGPFGSVMAVAHVILGSFVGISIQLLPTWQSRLKRWLLGALLLGLLGGGLCGFSKEEGLIPLNKTLWSLSFVCVMVAMSLVLYSLIYYVVDVQQLWSGYPFTECGMNGIILFLGHLFILNVLPWHWAIGAMNTHFLLLCENVWSTLIWVAIALYLHNRKFYYHL